MAQPKAPHYANTSITTTKRWHRRTSATINNDLPQKDINVNIDQIVNSLA